MSYSLIVILNLALLSFITRALPFVFSKVLQHSAAMKLVGKYLPAHLMLLLVLYEIDLDTFSKSPYGIPAILGLFVVLVIHTLKRIMILSIAAGTATFMLATTFFT